MTRATVELRIQFDTNNLEEMMAALGEGAQRAAAPNGQADAPASISAPSAVLDSAAIERQQTEPPHQAVATKKRTAKPAGDGAARKPLTEPEMRALLSEVSSAHPQKVASVVALLQTHGGSPRLLDCPQERWIAIEDAARGVLTELQAPP